MQRAEQPSTSRAIITRGKDMPLWPEGRRKDHHTQAVPQEGLRHVHGDQVHPDARQRAQRV
eukprot:16001203-Heterocapsa_arctica.AAC.1